MSTELTTRSATDLILDPGVMGQLYKVAEMMASSHITVPKHLQQSPGDCMAICMQSAQWGMNPFAVAQKTHLVNGNLGYEAQLVNAVISSSKAIRGRFHYDFGQWEGENGLIRVGAVLAGEEDITWGEWLDTGAVKVKNSPLWKTAPKQQAAYLAVKMWARLYCPEVILGVYTADEFDDTPPKPEKDITPPAPEKPKTAEALFAEIQVHDKVSQGAKPQEDAQDLEEGRRNADISLYVDSKIKEYDDAAGFPDKQKHIVELAEHKLSQKPEWLETFRSAIA